MKTEPETLELIGHQKLLVERKPSENILKLLSRDGQLRLTITITEDGPVLRFEGPSLKLESSGELAVDAQRLALHGREGVAISSGADASICVAGDLKSEARIQDITARRGNVNLNANDDVRLRAERIRLNC
jgi:hypothetical protein